MMATQLAEKDARAVCTNCGIPLDARHFDESGIADLTQPGLGRDVVLASFQLPPQYCGELQYFAQFSDAFAKDNSQIATPGLRWLILVDERPLYPYLDIEWILNPWGYGSFPFRVRLDEGTNIQFLVRQDSGAPGNVKSVGGRITGRYWYNPAYGDVRRSRL